MIIFEDKQVNDIVKIKSPEQLVVALKESRTSRMGVKFQHQGYVSYADRYRYVWQVDPIQTRMILPDKKYICQNGESNNKIRNQMRKFLQQLVFHVRAAISTQANFEGWNGWPRIRRRLNGWILYEAEMQWSANFLRSNKSVYMATLMKHKQTTFTK